VEHVQYDDLVAVVLTAIELNLIHSLATTVRASFVVGVDPGLTGQAVEVSGQCLTKSGHLTQGLVGEHVCGVPVDRSVAVQNHLVVTVAEDIVTCISSTRHRAVLQTAGCIAGEGVTTTATNIKPVLEVRRLGEAYLTTTLSPLPG
jgi:hypothetical protein